MTEPLATVTGHESMVEAFRIAKEMRNLSNEFCDEAGDFAGGQTDKVLGPTRSKNLGPITIDEFCKMFAVKFIMVRDVENEACMKDVWEGRQTSHVRRNAHRMSKALLERAQPFIFREMSRRAAAARKIKISAPMRAKIAKRAARARWRKAREARVLAKLATAAPIHPRA